MVVLAYDRSSYLTRSVRIPAHGSHFSPYALTLRKGSGGGVIPYLSCSYPVFLVLSYITCHAHNRCLFDTTSSTDTHSPFPDPL